MKISTDPIKKYSYCCAEHKTENKTCQKTQKNVTLSFNIFLYRFKYMTCKDYPKGE